MSDPTAFPVLTSDQLARLSAFGQQRDVTAGTMLYVEDDLNVDLVVILEGEADAIHVDRAEDTETIVSTHGPGTFLNELSLLTGQRVVLRSRMRTDGRVLIIDHDQVGRVMASDVEIGDVMFAAFMARRENLRGGAMASTLRIIGSRYSRGALELVSYAQRQRLPHQWIDLDGEEDVQTLLSDLSIRSSDTPVVVWLGEVMRGATVGALAARLGLSYEPAGSDLLDVVIIGAGPAGLAAAVYGASEGLDTLLIDRVNVGGQAGTSSRIENYVGFPTGISGGELVERAALQAQRLGARISAPTNVTGIESTCDGYRLTLVDGEVLTTRAVVLALGVQYRKLPLLRLKEFEGAGVYYAATDLEARVCGHRPVTIIGGGNSAGQAAVFLAQRGATVTIVIRGEDLTSSMSSYLIDRIETSPAITVRAHSAVTDLHGSSHLEVVTITDNVTGSAVQQPCVGLFSFIGAVPFTDWLADFVQLDAHGFILTDNDLHDVGFEPLPFETSRPGIFAAGDVRAGSMKRVAAAVGDGSSAIRSVHQRLAADS